MIHIYGALKRLEAFMVTVLSIILPKSVQQALLSRIADRHLDWIVQVLGSRINRQRYLDNMPFDLPIEGAVQFENLIGLFASTPLDHGAILTSVRSGAYLYGIAKHIKARKVIEVGRYKGGSTLLLSAGMSGKGTLWTIDIGEKEARLDASDGGRPFDQQLSARLKEFNLNNVQLIVGDSRTLGLETGEVDLVFIDGDHSYEGAKNDFERFGKRVRVGGALLFDDAIQSGLFPAH